MFEIERDLEQLNQAGDVLKQRLDALTQFIQYMFNLIRDSKTRVEAESYFDVLDNIQQALADLVYKKEIGIPDRLWRFMNDFDNFQEAKMFYFEKIKAGEYKF